MGKLWKALALFWLNLILGGALFAMWLDAGVPVDLIDWVACILVNAAVGSILLIGNAYIIKEW